MNANFHRAFQLGQMYVPMASAPLGMLCLDSVFSLPVRLLPWNGHRLGMTVTTLKSWLGATEPRCGLSVWKWLQETNDKELEIRNALNLHKNREIWEFCASDNLNSPSAAEKSASTMRVARRVICSSKMLKLKKMRESRIQQMLVSWSLEVEKIFRTTLISRE